MNPKKIVLATLVGGACWVAAGAASAAPLDANSSISFAGQARPLGPAPLNWGTATGIDFGAAVFIDGTGDYAAVPFLTPVTFTDFTFAPVFAPATPLWSFTVSGTTYMFSLTQIDSLSQTGGSLSSLNLSGRGTLAIGANSSAGTFIFTGNSATATNGGTTFSFSGSNAAVPLPGTVALLGLGLVGLAALRRDRAAA